MLVVAVIVVVVVVGLGVVVVVVGLAVVVVVVVVTVVSLVVVVGLRVVVVTVVDLVVLVVCRVVVDLVRRRPSAGTIAHLSLISLEKKLTNGHNYQQHQHCLQVQVHFSLPLATYFSIILYTPSDASTALLSLATLIKNYNEQSQSLRRENRRFQSEIENML